MLCAQDAHKIEPHGRYYCTIHPGQHRHAANRATEGRHINVGPPLVRALGDINISEQSQVESWLFRQNPTTKEACDEELYVNGNVVVWSRGSTTSSGAVQVLRCFTVDTPVLQALWCNFLLPVDHTMTAQQKTSSQTAGDTTRTVAAVVQSSVCIVEAGCFNVFTADGRDYVAALPFMVKKTWVIQNGLLFERKIVPVKTDHSKTPSKKDNQQTTKLPVLFSLSHPLDEMAPVICRTGGNTNSAKVSFVTELSQEVVYTSQDPSLIMIYDKQLGVHSVWSVRQAKPDELELACNVMSGAGVCEMSRDVGMTPSAVGATSHSISAISRFTISSQSPSIDSPAFHTSRLNSPSLAGVSGMSRLNSPSLSRLTAHSRSQSPSLATSGLYRLHNTPSPQVKSSPVGFNFQSPGGSATSFTDHMQCMEFMEALIPEICLDHIWTEPAHIPRDGNLGVASKVFEMTDFGGQHYWCYLVSYRHHLRCVKFEMSNDLSQLIFGALSIIQARDAVPLTSLHMMAVLDMNHSVSLYSGLTKMNLLHVPGLPSLVSLSTGGSIGRSSPKPDSPSYGTTLYGSDGPTTSSRPASSLFARLDEEVQLLSPVPTEFNESSQLLVESSMLDEPSITNIACSAVSRCGLIMALRDAVDNRFTIELTDGALYRTSLTPLTTSPIIGSCLSALRQTLPRDAAMLVHCRWYCYHNAPGGSTACVEWQQFVICLLGIMGYNANSAARTLRSSGLEYELNSCLSPAVQLKKPRLSEQGSNDDWQHLLNSDHHQVFCATNSQQLGFLLSTEETRPAAAAAAGGSSDESVDCVDTNAPLFTHIATVLYALHLVYEDMRLDTVLHNSLLQLGSLLFFIARDVGCELYVDHYCRDLPVLMSLRDNTRPIINHGDLTKIQYSSFFTHVPPNIYQWLYNYLRRQQCSQFPCIPQVTTRLELAIVMFLSTFDKPLVVADASLSQFVKRVLAAGRRLPETSIVPLRYLSQPGTGSHAEQLVLSFTDIDSEILKNFAVAVTIPLHEAIFACRTSPPTIWPQDAYNLVGRDDMARQRRLDDGDTSVALQRPVVMTTDKNNAIGKTTVKDDSDGMNFMDEELLNLRFSDDQRVKEVRRLLRSSQPVRISITQRPEVSDHEFIDEQERHLYMKCIRTMALPVGRGMFTLCSYHPVPTETVTIPKLCLTGRVPPRNTTVDLTHIDTPANMNTWSLFHNGVAAGLKISNTSQLESTWILFNKARSETLTNEHAGFLMGQGLIGHLSSLATLNVHDYLIKGHEMTSMGLLLGIAANKRGTMDIATTKLLSIHVAALLPPTSTELDVPHVVQVASVLGVGLVYQGTAHRHIAEVLLTEIGRPPGPEADNCVDRESYSLAAGLALGLVMLGKGCEVLGLSDMAMPDMLNLYMVGGQKRPLSSAYRERYKSPSYQIKEGENVNIDVTAPGATLALGLMFFNTNNSSVAEWFDVPDTQSLLDVVRPDFLLLRTLSRSLIMWNSVKPSETWVHSNLPKIVAMYAFNKIKYASDTDCDIDFETMSQAYCHIVAGACMSVGLKFAGSADNDAFICLYEMVKRMLKLLSRPSLVEQAGKMTVENCLIVINLSLAMVMAGTGDLRVLRLCRYLRSRVGAVFGYIVYGSHLAVSMSIGLLFLGGGKYTLSTKPEAIAAMLCAFFPKFPIHSNDNRYHLQAFRHLYVLAAEKRVVIPRDVDSNCACYVELELVFKNDERRTVMAPCLLPELHLLNSMSVKGPRYWSVAFTSDTNWETLKKLLQTTGCVFVKQRAGYLSYSVDPKGYHSVLAKSLTTEQMYGKILQSKDIKSFSSDPRILAFAEQFCTATDDSECEMSQLFSQLLYEAVSQEKLQIIASQIALLQCVKQFDTRCRPIDLWQLKLLLAFYERMSWGTSHQRLLSEEFLIGLQSRVEASLRHWMSNSAAVFSRYFHEVQSEATDFNISDWSKLSAFLIWFSVPHPKALAQMTSKLSQGVVSFPELYTILRPSGLRVSSILALCDALTLAAHDGVHLP